MTNLEITIGTKVVFTPTNVEFTLAKVTEARVSWYVGNTFKGGNGINNLKMAWTSIKDFKNGLDKGTYKLI
jgi:hypothetical protein